MSGRKTGRRTAAAWTAGFGIVGFAAIAAVYFIPIGTLLPFSPSPRPIHCTGPNAPSECEPEAQWVAAEAALRAADIAYWQMWIGLAGAIGLVATLAYTARATRAATRAAEASDAALQHAREVSYHELRAYLSLGLPTVALHEGTYLTARFPILNTGQTPATNVIVNSGGWMLAYPLRREEVASLTTTEHPPVEIMPHGQRGRHLDAELSPTDVMFMEQALNCKYYRISATYETYTGQQYALALTEWIVTGPQLLSGNVKRVVASDFALDESDERFSTDATLSD